jgi:putative ABC transport system substrate-binding protein
VIEFHNLTEEAAAHATAREFVRSGVDVIVAIGNPTVRAAKAATRETPVVMLHAVDPVAEGFVTSLARPGGNITGFVYFAVSPAKHLEILKEIVRRLHRVLVLFDPRDALSEAHGRELRAAAQALRVELIERQATDHTDVERIVGSVNAGDIDGVMLGSTSLQIRLTRLLLHLATLKRIPAPAYSKESVSEGALFSYAADIASIGRQAAVYVDRVVKGTKPADLPVEQPTRFELVINARTARALALTIPRALLLRADQVIE